MGGGGMKKQPDVTEATKRRILNAFWELFSRESPEKITAAALSAAAGIHRSSFYRYFADIYQVLEVFQEGLLCHLKTEVETIQATTDISLPTYTEKVSVLLIGSADKIYRLLNYKGSNFREQFIETLKPNVKKYIPLDRQNPNIEYITAFIISSMLFNFTFWYEHKEQYELSQVTALGKSIILHGLPKSLTPI